MSTLAFSFELAQRFYSSSDRFPIDFDDAWMWLEFSTKSNAKRSFLKAGFVEGVDFQVFIINDENPLGGRPVEQIRLSCECFKQWGMMAGTEKGKEIRLYFLECERIAKEIQQPQPNPELPQSYLEALKALVQAEEEKERLRLQAEQLTQENNELMGEVEQLSEVCDELFDYSSIIRVAKFNEVSETRFSWRVLKLASARVGEEIKKAPCPRFVSKNLYHHRAWMMAYPWVKLPETTSIVISR